MAKRTPRSAANDTATAAPQNPRRREPTEDDIRRRAYERYIERGASDGLDLEDWIEAEKELKGK